MKLRLEFDKSLALTALFLMGLGLVQVYSSSFIFATENFGDGYYFIRRQFIFSILGVVTLFSIALMPWKHVRLLGITAWAACLIGVVLTLVPSMSIQAGGATRWLRLPFDMRFEPSEGLKICYPFIVAFFMFWKTKLKLQYKKMLTYAVLALPFYFLMKQPDFGSLVICISVMILIYFAFGLSYKKLFLGAGLSFGAFAALIMSSSYRMSRLEAFLNPWSDPSDKGFQVIQSMLSVQAGGLVGRGLGQSQAKLFFLPEAHTDFTFAIFAEEWGFLGVAVVLLLYGFLLFKGLKISAQCKDPTGRAVAIGTTSVLALNIFINLGVVFGLLPPKGLTLPFMSYGGSSLLMVSFAIGVLLCISRQVKISDNFNYKSYLGRYYKIDS